MQRKERTSQLQDMLPTSIIPRSHRQGTKGRIEIVQMLLDNHNSGRPMLTNNRQRSNPALLSLHYSQQTNIDRYSLLDKKRRYSQHKGLAVGSLVGSVAGRMAGRMAGRTEERMAVQLG